MPLQSRLPLGTTDNLTVQSHFFYRIMGVLVMQSRFSIGTTDNLTVQSLVPTGTDRIFTRTSGISDGTE